MHFTIEFTSGREIESQKIKNGKFLHVIRSSVFFILLENYYTDKICLYKLMFIFCDYKFAYFEKKISFKHSLCDLKIFYTDKKFSFSICKMFWWLDRVELWNQIDGRKKMWGMKGFERVFCWMNMLQKHIPRANPHINFLAVWQLELWQIWSTYTFDLGDTSCRTKAEHAPDQVVGVGWLWRFYQPTTLSYLCVWAIQTMETQHNIT